MSRTLCERKRDLKHDLDAYVQLVCPANFVCAKCGRAASKKKYLCEPVRIAADVRSDDEREANLEWFPLLGLRAESGGR
jgi:hypothetical protein